MVEASEVEVAWMEVSAVVVGIEVVEEDSEAVVVDLIETVTEAQ